MFKLPEVTKTADLIDRLIQAALAEKLEEILAAASAGVRPDPKEFWDWTLGDRAQGDGTGFDLMDRLFVLNRSLMRDFGYREPRKGQYVSRREREAFKLLAGKRPGDLSQGMAQVTEIAHDPGTCFSIAFRNLLAAPLAFRDREFEGAANLSAVGQFFMLAGIIYHYKNVQSQTARKRAVAGHVKDLEHRNIARSWFTSAKQRNANLSKAEAAKRIHMEHVVPKSIVTIRGYLKGV